MKFEIIICDCPWNFKDRLTMDKEIKRGAEANYSTMSIGAIKTMPVAEIAADDALLCLWVPGSLIQEGLDVVKSWNFKPKQIGVWVKTKKHDDSLEMNVNNLAFGMGRTFRQAHEIFIVATRGKIYQHLQNRSQRSVFFAPNLKHSQKPEILQDQLEIMFPDPKIKKLEIFGRRSRKGWTVIGNQSPKTMSEDILVSLEKLKKR